MSRGCERWSQRPLVGRPPPAWLLVWALPCVWGRWGSRVASAGLPSLLEGRAAEHRELSCQWLLRCPWLRSDLCQSGLLAGGVLAFLQQASWESPPCPAACAGVPSGGAGRPVAGGWGSPGPTWAGAVLPWHCCYRLLGLKASSCVVLLGAGFRGLPLCISVWSTESVSWLLQRIIH